jgi:hypothetical protein
MRLEITTIKIMKMTELEYFMTADPGCENTTRKVEAALKAGHTVITGATKVWRTTSPLFNHEKSGSAAYEWHSDGNRCRHLTTEWSMNLDTGEVTSKERNTSWMKF